MYAILRAKKLKTKSQITNAIEHNLRLRTQSNIDPTRICNNRVLLNTLAVNLKSSTDFQEKLFSFYSELGIKEKTDNVLLYEYVATASPEFFKNLSSHQTAAWADDQVKFMQTQFGTQLKFAVLHLDEKTPHLHFFVSTEIKSVKKYKNRYGENFKESWSLNSRRYDPDFLTELQTKFASNNKIWGLTRGVKNSKRKNIPLKDFYRMVDKALSTNYKKEINTLIDDIQLSLGERLSIASVKEKIKEQLAPQINGLMKQHKAFKEMLKIDFRKLQQDLTTEKKNLDAISIEVEEKRALYKAAINGRMLDIQANEILMEQNLVLVRELDRLKNKYEPTQEIKRWNKP